MYTTVKEAIAPLNRTFRKKMNKDVARSRLFCRIGQMFVGKVSCGRGHLNDVEILKVELPVAWSGGNKLS